MTLSETIELIEKADRCKFSTYGYACGKHVEHGRYLCEEHATAKCASCGQPATHGCDFCGQFVCGTPLCDECTFGTDDSKSSGAWGFMNHIHISRPEFADKHDNRRLKEENAALALQLDAMQREMAEKDARIAALEAGIRPFSKYAGVVFERNFNNSDPVDTMTATDGAVSTLYARDFFTARTLIQGEKQ